MYLDPPFNSNRNYAAPIGSATAGAAFKDAWTLSDVDEAWHGEIAERDERLYKVIDAAGLVHGKSMKSYLIFITVRILELHRVLKPTEDGLLKGGKLPKVIHRTDLPRRTDIAALPDYRTHKHVLYGEQAGNCKGCGVHFPFQNMTVDHITPRAKGGGDHKENLQLLCNSCNSRKGSGTQAELIVRLREAGILYRAV